MKTINIVQSLTTIIFYLQLVIKVTIIFYILIFKKIFLQDDGMYVEDEVIPSIKAPIPHYELDEYKLKEMDQDALFSKVAKQTSKDQIQVINRYLFFIFGLIAVVIHLLLRLILYWVVISAHRRV